MSSIIASVRIGYMPLNSVYSDMSGKRTASAVFNGVAKSIRARWLAYKAVIRNEVLLFRYSTTKGVPPLASPSSLEVKRIPTVPL